MGPVRPQIKKVVEKIAGRGGQTKRKEGQECRRDRVRSKVVSCHGRKEDEKVLQPLMRAKRAQDWEQDGFRLRPKRDDVNIHAPRAPGHEWDLMRSKRMSREPPDWQVVGAVAHIVETTTTEFCNKASCLGLARKIYHTIGCENA